MTRTRSIFLTLVLLALSVTTARADALRCQRTLAKESAKYVQAITKALQRCEDAKVMGGLPASTDCSTQGTAASLLQKAGTRVRARVAQSCGGADRTCGTADDDALASIGWGSVATCPGLQGAACNGAIQHCGDVAECVACVDAAAVRQGITLYYGALQAGEFGSGSALNRCQRAIGAEAAKFVKAKSKALQRCWDTRLKSRHANPCPVPGDGKAAAKIAKAEAKKVSRICAACGGDDRQCGGGDDAAPSGIGFVASCPNVTPPGDTGCAASIASAQDIVTCVDCVSEFAVDCADALAVAGLTAYPAECRPTSTTTTSSITATSSTSTSTTTQPSACPPPPAVPLGTMTFTIGVGADNCLTPAVDQTSGQVDNLDGTKRADLGLGCLYVGGGAATLIPPLRLPDGGSSVLAVAGVSGLLEVQVTASDGSGPADCTKGSDPGRHCINAKPGLDGNGTCISDADCANKTGSCDYDAHCFFGSPVPVPLGGLSVCIVNAVAQDVCGSANLVSNTTNVSANLSARIYLTGNGASPCPQCGPDGLCTAGQRVGLSCTAGGVGSAHTTIECPPRDTQYFGRLGVNLSSLNTGTSTLEDPAGIFCAGQPTPGAFAGEARRIVEMGAPLLSGGGLFDTTLAGTFCVPATGNETFDGIADLPGPGAVSVPGTIEIDLF